MVGADESQAALVDDPYDGAHIDLIPSSYITSTLAQREVETEKTDLESSKRGDLKCVSHFRL